ncbi:hypothetical protein EIP91_009130 [Steccherinum ochraceum]|uniref:F-box domain-containing protein n=1 Tax=Steccherinum ochraceum TaxID=92696 RepID=A0A4R0R215_9APHY|nr:hypothetical protein EIP91_009130 [Steccherinum ochraceum]
MSARRYFAKCVPIRWAKDAVETSLERTLVTLDAELSSEKHGGKRKRWSYSCDVIALGDERRGPVNLVKQDCSTVLASTRISLSDVDSLPSHRPALHTFPRSDEDPLPGGPRLPPEVCEMVIEALGRSGDWDRRRQTLLACMLVCRDWVPKSRFYLTDIVIFRSRNSFEAFSRMMKRSPEIRERMTDVRILVGDAEDQSWVSCVPTLLPPQLKSLLLDGINLTTLHPTATSRFGTVQVRHLKLRSLKFTRNSQVTRLVHPASACVIEWSDGDADHVPRGGGGHILAKPKILEEIKLEEFYVKTVVDFLRNIIVLSAVPFAVDITLKSGQWHSVDPIMNFSFTTNHSVPTSTIKTLPEDHKALWRHVRRLWRMPCCRTKETALLENLGLGGGPNGITLSRKLQTSSRSASSSESGDSSSGSENEPAIPLTTLDVVGVFVEGTDFLGYASCVLHILSHLESLEEITIDLDIYNKRIVDQFVNATYFKCLDDALSLPGFKTVLKVTLELSAGCSSPIPCEHDQSKRLLPLTYARGVIPPKRCENKGCEKHHPPRRR